MHLFVYLSVLSRRLIDRFCSIDLYSIDIVRVHSMPWGWHDVPWGHSTICHPPWHIVLWGERMFLRKIKRINLVFTRFAAVCSSIAYKKMWGILKAFQIGF